MEIDIPQDVVEQLEQIAQKEGRSVGDVLKRLLSRYVPDAPPGSLAELARNAQEAGIASPHPVDTAAHSREILNTEYTEYLKRRTKPGADDHNR